MHKQLISLTTSSSVLHTCMVKHDIQERELFGHVVERTAPMHAVIVMAIYIIENAEKMPAEDIYHCLAKKAIWQQSLETLSFVKEVFIESGLIQAKDNEFLKDIDLMIKRDSIIAYLYSKSICMPPRSGKRNSAKKVLYLSMASCLGHLVSWSLLHFHSITFSKWFRSLYYIFIFVILLLSIPASLIRGVDDFYWRYYDLRGLIPKSVSRIDGIFKNKKIGVMKQ
ncbi:MAG: hypothetical protein LAT61_10760 [Alcanivorax sp.]|nr:hypothetical protein [Alcanivorax sp.]